MEKSISLYLQYKKIVSDIEECEEIISSGEDKEMTLLAKEEHSFAMKEKERLTDELKIALLPVDPNDDKNVIVEVRPAAGGDESALFGAELVRMYMRFAERQRWKIKELDMNYNELGGVKEVTFMISDGICQCNECLQRNLKAECTLQLAQWQFCQSNQK